MVNLSGNIRVTEVVYECIDEMVNSQIDNRLSALRRYIQHLDTSTRKAHVHMVASAPDNEQIQLKVTIKSDDTFFKEELELAIAEYIDTIQGIQGG